MIVNWLFDVNVLVVIFVVDNIGEFTMGVEYDYVHKPSRKLIELGKGGLWQDLFYDFVDFGEPYSVGGYVEIIRDVYPLWSEDHIVEISEKLHWFLSIGDKSEYVCVGDDILILPDRSCVCIDEDELIQDIKWRMSRDECRVWSRYGD